MSDCVFCDIVSDESPASVTYKDTVALAFMDIAPINPGHLLVVPQRHVPFLAELDEATGMHLFRIATRLADAVQHAGIRCEGVNLFLADGSAAGQEVDHVHLHVIPRFAGDDFTVAFDRPSSPPSRETLDQIAASIRDAYESRWGTTQYGFL